MKKLSLLTDEELAMEYVKGNNRAFDELLSRTQTGIFSLLYITRKWLTTSSRRLS